MVSACKENHFYRSQHLRPPFAFTSSTKRENKHFHVVVVQRRQRNVQKSVMHVRVLTTNCFLPFSLTSLSSLLKLPIETPAVEKSGVNKISWVLNFFFQASLCNCINCVHCDDHFFIFVSFPQFIYDLFHVSLKISWVVRERLIQWVALFVF